MVVMFELLLPAVAQNAKGKEHKRRKKEVRPKKTTGLLVRSERRFKVTEN